jgi:hopanoid biosynthesis associated radical SAM protein HpnH
MLEPLFRCNLACAGCGKIQQSAEVLRKELTPEECFAAAAECNAPVVSVAGGEPLLHSRIAELVAGLTAQGRYVYLCTNGLLLKEKLPLFHPSKRLSFSVHLDGPEEVHDAAVRRPGVFAQALQGLRAAVAKGFRVTTNTTLYLNAEAAVYRRFFDELMALGVEGLMLSPGFAYDQAPDQDRFLLRRKSQELFRELLLNRSRTWRFNQSPLFLDFLMGFVDLECLPWGSPTYNLFGWQRPCYLLQDGHARTFKEFIEDTDWRRYGRRSSEPRCRDCLMHCGFEPSAVDYTFGGPLGLLRTARSILFRRRASATPSRVLAVPSFRPDRQHNSARNGTG